MFVATPLPGKNYLHKQSIAPCSRFDGMSERTKISLAAAASIALLSVSAFLGLDSDIRSLVADDRSEATIEVDATRTLGEVPLYIFGENLEHEHGAINGNEQNQNNAHGLHTGGIWAEMLRDRKFEEGDLDEDGVANGWVPEERITNHYDDLKQGQGPSRRYRIDHREYYGGGASQAIDLSGDETNHASIYQILLHFAKGRRYAFYVYLKQSSTGTAWVEFEKLGGPVYARRDLPSLSPKWQKYTAEFVAPEDTDQGRVRIARQDRSGGVVGTGLRFRAPEHFGLTLHP